MSTKNTESSGEKGQEVVSQKERNALTKVALFFLEVIKIVIMAGVTIGLVRYFLFKPFYVKGQSMEPSFYEHEYLIVDELTYRFRTPERGEVVVLHSPTQQGDYLLKRVVGLPGERIKIEDNKVIIYNEAHPEGRVLDEVYLAEETPGSVMYTLGADQYFLMGDNRDASYDSRRFGPVAADAIIGRAFIRGWPLGRIGTLFAPDLNI